jgi:hypothetical protein
MTTAPLPNGTSRRSAPVLSPEVRTAGSSTLVLSLVLVGLAALLAGGAAAAGAAIGAATVLIFFASGALTVNAVAGVSPGASLLVALLTYVLQVVAIGVVLLTLRRSGALDSAVDPHWVAGALIAATLVWLVAQTVAATRSRQPLYDLPERGPDGAEASAR